MLANATVRERIALLRFIMIFGVVVLHTPDYVPIAEVGGDWFSLLKAYFQNSLFRTTVPMLTLLSGYLLFYSNIDQKPRKLASKKFGSLAIPFLAFNLPLLLVAYVAESTVGLQISYKLGDFDPRTWLDAAFGIWNSPINYPLNFLRDMIVLMCLAPLFGVLIRRMPTLGAMLVTLVFLNDLDGPLILRGVMPVLFYMGGLAAVYKWNVNALDRFALPCLLILLLLCGLIVQYRIANTNYLRLAAPVLIWPAAALLNGNRIGAWCARMNRYSFLIFVAHAPLLLALWMAYKMLGRPVPYIVFWVGAPVLVAACLVGLHKVGMRIAPRPLSTLLGGRGGDAERPAAVSKTPDPAYLADEALQSGPGARG